MIPDHTSKGVFFIAISQFGLTFSFSFMMAFMPFYIIKISTLGPKETMIWIGMILGAPHIITALTAPFWGALTSRFSPKLLYERGFLCHGILILLMGFTNNLYLLLLLRILQGTMGGVSTIGLILTSSLSPSERIHKDLSLFQNSMTIGQLAGPLLGTYTASLLGYRAAFIFTFIIIFMFLFFCHRHVSNIPPQEKRFRPEGSYKKALFFGWVLSLVATIHLAFIPGILPNILKGFQMMENDALNAAGMIIMSYTGTAILGNYFLSHLSTKMGVRKVITVSCLLATLFQVLLILSEGVISFLVIRMIQTGFIAAIFPLTISIFARDAGGRMMGFLNSARFVGMAIGPIMATSILAYFNLPTLYLFIAGITLGSLWRFLTANKNEKTKIAS
jgi:DHA1 family multidrug resistance protein-like MFS transporter